MTSQPVFAHNWLASPHLENPYPLFVEARQTAPIFYSPIFNLWCITRYRDVRAALMDPQRFSSKFLIRTPYTAPPKVIEALNQGYAEEQVLVNEDPPDHSRTRHLVNQAFAPRRIYGLEPQIKAITNRLIDAFIGAGQADVVAELAAPLPLAVLAELIGLPHEDLGQIKRWTEDLIMLTSTESSLERQVAGAQGSVAFQRYLEAQIAERRQTPRDDLLSTLTQFSFENGERWTDSQLISLLISVIFAGHETTTNLIGNLLLQVFGQPGLWQQLQAEPARVPDAIEEALRIDGPIRAMFRVTTEDVALDGATIPAGSQVLLLFGAANRDDEMFAEPDRFDIDRPNKEQHLGFGRGIHFCVGATLARLEARIALTTLAERIPQARLAPDYRPTYLPSLLHRGPQRLHLIWDKA
ncbi:MAG: cytochrome P450 [Chloroflexi bacterium]|nr:cytochrome P450 [Chloroflexota bacterium]